jgi:hypothetical protein
MQRSVDGKKPEFPPKGMPVFQSLPFGRLDKSFTLNFLILLTNPYLLLFCPV